MRVLTESAERFVILLLQTQLVDEQSKVKDQQLGEARPVQRRAVVRHRSARFLSVQVNIYAVLLIAMISCPYVLNVPIWM